MQTPQKKSKVKARGTKIGMMIKEFKRRELNADSMGQVPARPKMALGNALGEARKNMGGESKLPYSRS